MICYIPAHNIIFITSNNAPFKHKTAELDHTFCENFEGNSFTKVSFTPQEVFGSRTEWLYGGEKCNTRRVSADKN